MERPPSDRRDDGFAHLLATLERLLGIDAPSIPAALQEASDLLAETLHAEKVDAFVYERADDLLVAVGTSHTPLGRQQHALGLHRLPLSAAGRTGWVFATHTPFRTGQLEQDPWEIQGVIEDLGIRSTIATPVLAASVIRLGQRRHGPLTSREGASSRGPQRCNEAYG